MSVRARASSRAPRRHGEGLRVCQQTGLGRDDSAVLQSFQAVLAKGRAGGSQVGYEIGVTGDGGGFERSRGRGEGEVVDAAIVEEVAEQAGVLGGDTELLSLLPELQGQVGKVCQGSYIQPCLRDGEDELAASVTQVFN